MGNMCSSCCLYDDKPSSDHYGKYEIKNARPSTPFATGSMQINYMTSTSTSKTIQFDGNTEELFARKASVEDNGGKSTKNNMDVFSSGSQVAQISRRQTNVQKTVEKLKLYERRNAKIKIPNLVLVECYCIDCINL